jgi:hypothetical protein
MTLNGHVHNGVVILDDPVGLPEGTKVRVEAVEPTAEQPEGEAATLYERLKPVIGQAQGLPEDASLQVDHYLYGHPKK